MNCVTSNCIISLVTQVSCVTGATAIPPTHRAVDLMEAKSSEARGLSRARLSARRRRRASPLDSPLDSENRRFHEVDGASCRSAANDDPAAAGGGGLAWDRKRRPSRCNFLGRDTDRLFVIRRRRRDRRSRTTAPYVTVARPARSPSRRPSRRPFRPAVTPRSDAPRSAARRG